MPASRSGAVLLILAAAVSAQVAHLPYNDTRGVQGVQAYNERHYYYFDVPMSGSSLGCQVDLYPIYGDPDLYLYQSDPSSGGATSFAASTYGASYTDVVTVSATSLYFMRGGRLYISVVAWSANSYRLRVMSLDGGGAYTGTAFPTFLPVSLSATPSRTVSPSNSPSQRF